MPKELKTNNLSLRPSPDVLDRLDRLAAAVTASTGTTARRGGVALDALLLGLVELERRNTLRPKAARRAGEAGK